ncbi:MAG: formate C-acetyltransferase/glycerol dehydratase family glycyl radical enzyme [Clostridiaceae bacterium]
MEEIIKQIDDLGITLRIKKLKEKMLDEPRYLSIEQARIITDVYKQNEEKPLNLKRAICLAESLKKIEIRIDAGELIVGNRTAGVRAGVVFPEPGISWVDREIETLPARIQDKFNVHPEDIGEFRKTILPYWKGKTLEDQIQQAIGEELGAIGKAVKINQTDHAQGHICPNTEKWLKYGPSGLKNLVGIEKEKSSPEKQTFFEGLEIVLDSACIFMERYAGLAAEMAAKENDKRLNAELDEISRICRKLSRRPPETFYEAVQSVWFLFVILHMESNASSFSPGRMDQYLYPYYKKDFTEGSLTLDRALEIIEALWLKFNQIVYLRNSNSAKYFAGFPIGFNVALGGQTQNGEDASNELSYLFLKAQEHIGLPQPNLSARLFKNSPDSLLKRCAKVIGKGSGMPQIFNDEAVIPALKNKGIRSEDAVNYAIVGCVELTTHGNTLGWSDAAMFNMVKVLELALNNGKCMLTGKQMGVETGTLRDFETYEDLEYAYEKQIDYFTGRMIKCCEAVEKMHADILPSPFLSSVIDDCILKGTDVTAGGACNNLSGIQAIQAANIADSLSALKLLVYKEKKMDRNRLYQALLNNFENEEPLRLTLLNHAPKYGNDVEWVDEIAHKWIEIFAKKLGKYKNVRGGIYHAGLYTVSAHVPMGQNVAATPDGRKARQPLADGGMSAVYGRDMKGPTALLKSVSRVDSMLGSNGTLLNMKFSPKIFETEEGFNKFSGLLKTFVALKIIHVQFNVVTKKDLLEAKKHPEAYRNLTIRVAGYTAYFTELAGDLQDEIIARTSYDGSGL